MFARKKCQFWINDLIIFKIVIFYTEHLIVFQPNMTWILKKRASVYFYKTSKHLKNKPQELNEKRKFGNFLQPIMAFTFSIFILFWQRSDFYKKNGKLSLFSNFLRKLTLKPPRWYKNRKSRGYRNFLLPGRRGLGYS